VNISLEKAVDYLKKDNYYDLNPNTKISDDVYNVLCGQLLVTRGKSFKRVGK
jgi:translation initiation factor IF-2